MYCCFTNSLCMMSSKIALYCFMDGLLGGVNVCDRGGICAWKPYVSPSMRLGYLDIRPARERKSRHADTLYGVAAAAWLRLRELLSTMRCASTARARMLGTVMGPRASLRFLPVMA